MAQLPEDDVPVSNVRKFSLGLEFFQPRFAMSSELTLNEVELCAESNSASNGAITIYCISDNGLGRVKWPVSCNGLSIFVTVTEGIS